MAAAISAESTEEANRVYLDGRDRIRHALAAAQSTIGVLNPAKPMPPRQNETVTSALVRFDESLDVDSDSAPKRTADDEIKVSSAWASGLNWSRTLIS